jgi:phenylalanyl-tRNA synthetase beta chain
MRVSTKWLRELVELDPAITPLSMADRLTLVGLEVEAIEDLASSLRGVIVARVAQMAPHPNAERLSLCQVDVGGDVRRVVCGAQNFKEGDLVAFATEGTVLPDGLVIKRSTIRGEVSEGMLCSEKELGLSTSHDGIIVLPVEKGIDPGVPLAQALGRDDTVLTLGVTPNRADALSHIGVAREVALAFDTRMRAPAPTCAERGGPIESFAHVTILDVEGCPRYGCRVIEDVSVGPSPQWLVSRLAVLGIRSVSNIVDVTNLVMMERGLPLHAFDLDKLAKERDRAEVIVRSAKAGETLRTLDDKERTLVVEDLVIADANGPIALAGVMGGADTEVTSTTTRILLEAAHFHPARIRRTARRLGLHSEASHRFERGADPNGVRQALDRAASLIAELGQGRVCRGIVDNYPKKIEPLIVNLRPKRVAQITGLAPKDVDETACSKLLLGLGLEVVGRDGESVRFRVPTHRSDLTREIDLVEEILRLHGYDKVPVTLPARSGEARGVFDEDRHLVAKRARAAFMAAGYSEAVNLSFTSPDENALFARVDDAPALQVQNPLGEEMSIMRRSLLPGLVRNAITNIRRGQKDVRLFEIATVFLGENVSGKAPDKSRARGDDAYAHERAMLAGILAGDRGLFAVGTKRSPADIYDAKGVVEELLVSLGLDVRPGMGAVRFIADETLHGFLHPRSRTRVDVQLHDRTETLGVIGALHPDVLLKIDVDGPLFVFELALDVLKVLVPQGPRFHALPRFPSVRRDLAFLVEERMQVDALCRALADAVAQTGLLEDVLVFDVFQGKGVPDGQKSVAISLVLRARDRTLTDDEVTATTASVVARLARDHGAVIRS